MRILMIEDEPRVADFVRRGLRTEGWAVETVPSAEEGLAMLTAGQYDLILLDVLLPGMSGEALCRHLRAIRNDVPILMLSALGSTDHRVSGLRNGPTIIWPSPSTLMNSSPDRGAAPTPDRPGPWVGGPSADGRGTEVRSSFPAAFP